MALIAHTQVTDSSACRGSDTDVPAGDANSYKADCDACNETPDFTFASGLGSDACLNYFVGHIEDACLVNDNAPTCQDEFWLDEHKADHIEYMVDKAYATDAKPDVGTAAPGAETDFCGYSDEACQAKIKDSIESSMSVIGW
eukprot:COSAG04_NODE_19044_length_426_cov_0.951070_1_plen_141_part_11